VTPRVLAERCFELVARGKAGEIASLLGRYPSVLGPLATWLGAYAAASTGALDVARAKVATLDPPPPGTALEARLIAAAAFGAMKDRRRGSAYVHDLQTAGMRNPDLVTAAQSLK
jgi:hypothetical protein